MNVDDVLEAHNRMAPPERRVTLRELFGSMPEYCTDQGTFRQRLADYASTQRCIHGAPFPSACLICFQLGIDN